MLSRILARATVLFAIALLTAAPAALASDTLVGLYTDQSGTQNNMDANGGTMTIYLVVSNPVNREYNGGGNRAISHIGGFEAQISFNQGTDFVVGSLFPVPAINVGDNSNIKVGFAEPVSTASSGTMLATVQVYTAGAQDTFVYLGPASPPSLDGSMVIIDLDDPESNNLSPMDPTSGDFQQPVFFINSEGPETDERNWGSIKSLYR